VPEALLRGREHTSMGAIAVIGEDACAIALSRGGARKPYRHKDPNEDVAGFVRGEGGVLLAVADGHSGCEAAEIAFASLFASGGQDWTRREAPADDWSSLAANAICAAHAAILASVAQGGNQASRTTLALALVRPGDDLLAWASIGDSHVFGTRVDAAVELAAASRTPTIWLGSPSLAEDELRERIAAGHRTLAALRAVVLATDGISERGIGFEAPGAAVLEVTELAADCEPQLRGLSAARSLIEQALEAHRRNRAGDNVATAVYWRD
jgi:serine/threonine protein phosphatase PrpC